MKIVEEECDESIYWIELLLDVKHIQTEPAKVLMKEADEILSLTVASIKTARSNQH